MSSEIQAFSTGFSHTLPRAAAAFVLLILASALYLLLSRHKEVEQIRDGNTASALAFGGAIVGLAEPLAGCLHQAASMLDLILGGAALVAALLAAFWVIDRLLVGLPQRAREGDVAAAAVLAAARLAAGLLLAATTTG